MLGSLICVALAFQDDNTDKYYTEPSNELVQTVAINTVLGSETYISEDSLNAFIAYLVQKANDTGLFSKDWTLTSAYIDINTGKPCKIYFQIDYNGRKLGFSADIDASIDETNGLLTLSFDNAYVGRLKIPRSLIVSALSKTNLENATSYLSINELSVTFPIHYEVKIEQFNVDITVDLIDLAIYEDEIYIKTNNVALDILDNIKGILGDKIGSFTEKFGDLF